MKKYIQNATNVQFTVEQHGYMHGYMQVIYLHCVVRSDHSKIKMNKSQLKRTIKNKKEKERKTLSLVLQTVKVFKSLGPVFSCIQFNSYSIPRDHLLSKM